MRTVAFIMTGSLIQIQPTVKKKTGFCTNRKAQRDHFAKERGSSKKLSKTIAKEKMVNKKFTRFFEGLGSMDFQYEVL